MHRDILAGSCPAEPPREQPVVLDVARAREQPRRHLARWVDHHRFVNLHLVDRPHLGVVRLESRGIRILVVPGDAPIRLHGTRLEHDTIGGIRHPQVDPGATRGICRRELVAGEVPHAHIGSQFGAIPTHIQQLDACRAGRQVLHCARDDGFHLLRRRTHTKLIAKPIEHAQREEVPAEEGVSRDIGARLSDDLRHRHILMDDGHVARLTARRIAIRTLLPLEVGHLLWQAAIGGSGGERMGEQGVARRAQFRLLHLRALRGLEPRGRLHHARAAAVDLERSEHPSRRRRHGRVDDVATGEARARSQPARLDLMTHGARHAI